MIYSLHPLKTGTPVDCFDCRGFSPQLGLTNKPRLQVSAHHISNASVNTERLHNSPAFEGKVYLAVDDYRVISASDENVSVHKLSGTEIALSDANKLEHLISEDIIEAVECYKHVQNLYITPSVETLVKMIQGCTSNEVLFPYGRGLHAHIIEEGLNLNWYICSALISMYAKCSNLVDACILLEKMSKRNVVVWSSLITGYVQHGRLSEGLATFEKMLSDGVEPDTVIFTSIIKACASSEAYEQGEKLHAFVIESGYALNVDICNALIDMYSKSGNFLDVCIVFHKMVETNVLTWNLLLSAHIKNDLFKDAHSLVEIMKENSVKPDSVTIVLILRICSNNENSEIGWKTHAAIIESGLEGDTTVGNALIELYANFRFLDAANAVFDKMPAKDAETWTCLISAYAQCEFFQEALLLMEAMHIKGVFLDEATFLWCLKSCTGLEELKTGRAVHAMIIEFGLHADTFLNNALVEMYGKCRSFDDARVMFNKILNRCHVSWNVFLGVQLEEPNLVSNAHEIYKQMEAEGIKPTSITFNHLLKMCTDFDRTREALDMHALILEGGLEANLYVGCALVDMYAKSGHMEAACRVFNRIPNVDVVTWSALMAGYATNEYYIEAVHVFQNLLQNGIQPTPITISCALHACSNMAALEEGRWIHSYAVEMGMEGESVGSSLINMYAKFGDLETAERVFDRLPEQSIATWNALISAYSDNASYDKACELYVDMQQKGFKPNEDIILKIIFSYSQKGILQDLIKLFKYVKQEHGVPSKHGHFNFIVDVLGHVKQLDAAVDMLETMPLVSNAVGWTCLLSLCRTNSNVTLGRYCFDRVILLEPDSASGFVLMSDIYASAGLMKDAEVVEELRKCSNAWKKPAKAFIEVNGEVHNFSVDDRKHPRIDAIQEKWSTLKSEMKANGYSPRVDLVLDSISEDKEGSLCGHSEKLAIAFGLISTPEGSTIRISKNIRMCADCHMASKLISKLQMREIVISDTYCVHFFKDGTCSCKDNY